MNHNVKERVFTFPYIIAMIAELCLKLSTYMQNSLLALYVIESGGTNAQAGLMTTLYMLASVIIRPVSGNLADKKGRFFVMILGSVIVCVATSFYFLPFTIALLLLMRVFQGIGFSFDGTGIYALASDVIPKSRMSEGMGYLGLAQTVSIALAPAIAVGLKNMFGFQFVFVLVFCLSAITIVTILILRPLAKKHDWSIMQVKAPKDAEKKTNVLEELFAKKAFNPAIFAFLLMFCGTTVTTFLITYASQSGIANPGIFFTVQAVMVAVSRLVVGKIHKRFGSAAVMIPGLACIMIGLIGISLKISIGTIILCAIFYGLGMGATQPEVSSLAVLMTDPDQRGRANSTVFMLMDLGGALSGAIFGVVSGQFGFPTIYTIAAVVIAFAICLFIFMKKRGTIL